MKTSSVESTTVWWLNPIWFVVATVLPISICAWLIPISDYDEYWRSGKNFKGADLACIILVVVAFVLGAAAASALSQRRGRKTTAAASAPAADWASTLPWTLIYRFFNYGLLITLLAYTIWLLKGFAVGLTVDTLLGVLRGDDGAVYRVKEIGAEAAVSGLTTATQFGMAVSLLGTLVACRFGWRQVRWRMAFLVFMSLARAVFFSERLALIEVVVPAALLWFHLKIASSGGRRARMLVFSLPVVSLLGIFTLFTITEYFRSWVNFYKTQGDSMLWHTFMRLLGYYVTALNNGTYLLQAQGLLSLPHYTLQWLWKFPLLSLIFPRLKDIDLKIDEEYQLILTHSANPEFNNPSGIFVSFLDYGIGGSLIGWLLAGFAGMWLYKKFQSQAISGLLLYPFYFLGLTELTRVFYWGDPRAFPTWVFLFVVLIIVKQYMKQAARRRWRSHLAVAATLPAFDDAASEF